MYDILTIEFASDIETENLVLAPRRAEDEEQIDLDPEQLTFISQKHRKIPQVRGDSMLHLTENREMLIRRASEQGAFARTEEHGVRQHLHALHEDPEKSKTERLFTFVLLQEHSHGVRINLNFIFFDKDTVESEASLLQNQT